LKLLASADNIFDEKTTKQSRTNRTFYAHRTDEGKNIGELKCVVKRDDTQVNWFKGRNHVVIKKDKYNIIERGKERILIINDVCEEDVGEYVCESGNYRVTLYLSLNTGTEFYQDSLSFGSIDSDLDKSTRSNRSASKPRIIRKQIFINDKTKTAELTCKVPDENTKVEWFRNNMQISATSKYRLEEDGKERSLVIRGLSVDDEGDYVCKTAKCKTTLHLNINTKYDNSEDSDHDTLSRNIFSPKSQLAKNELVFFENQTAYLKCYLPSRVDDIIWLKDGSLNHLTEGPHGKYSFKNNKTEKILIINNLNSNDSGRYICQNKFNPVHRVEFQVIIKRKLFYL
jgi:hypothetical protein